MKQDIRKVKNIEDWIRYFSDNLDWDIDFDEIDDIDDISYEYTPEELGLKPESCAKIRSLKQLRPLTNDQPWGIFCVEFEGNRFEITALRRILSTQIPRRRRYVTDRRTWNLNDLLFICSWGEGNETTLGLAHFEEREGVLPQLKVIYCAPAKEDTHNIHTFEERIGHLQWPSDPSDTESWRGNWSAAFTSGYRQTIHAAAELTKRLAEEALAIRDRILHTLEIETEQGYVHRLYNKFKEQLVHDMKEQDFADMYAQTIVYGLFSARCMDDAPETFSAAEAVEHIPNTNPFLKSLLQECLDVKTHSGISYDELEVGNVVDILAGIDPKEIVQDFGRQTGGGREDPVLHFYEEFLNAYDKTQKVQRGVYYTPQPVVNFIVRAVDDILKNEFGLKDGLASTETKLVEMPVEKAQAGKSGLKTVVEKVEVPAVQVLDPATGTGTFLRQVILQIYEDFKTAHKGETDAAIRKAWNEYVPEHLLSRINGFELMMAPYAVAHMKLAMVLQETGYDFQSDKRLQVYLTNTLEEPSSNGSQLTFFSDPLAMESVEANHAKANKGINILIGNPPYSCESANKNEWIGHLMDDFKTEPNSNIRLQEQNYKAINDDYVKFIRYALHRTKKLNERILAFINPHGFLDNPTFRGMRWSLLQFFSKILIVELHGDSRRKEICPDGSKDENVFDIQQGVCIFIGIYDEKNAKQCSVFKTDIYGLRNDKYFWLNRNNLYSSSWNNIIPQEPYYFFTERQTDKQSDYFKGFSTKDLFREDVMGIATARDDIVIGMDRNELKEKFERIADLSISDEIIAKELFKDKIEKANLNNTSNGWKLSIARKRISHTNIDSHIHNVCYRPFDNRYIFYSSDWIDRDRKDVMRHFINHQNLGLCLIRINRDEMSTVLVSDGLTDKTILSSKDNANVFPLYLYNEDLEQTRTTNFNQEIINKICSSISLQLVNDNHPNRDVGFSAYDLFCYIYSFLYSRKYQEKYYENLRSEFPRIPYPNKKDVFWKLVELGDSLICCHLMKNKEDKEIISFEGNGDNTITKAEYKNGGIYINKNQKFKNVDEKLWCSYIAAYQPLQKWMKDRKGMILSDKDIEHYKQMIAAIQRTIEIMDKIDQVIEL